MRSMKCLEHAVKFKDSFAVLKEDSLTKAEQLPKSLSKTICFFHRGKPKSGGSKLCTNMHILHTEYIQTIISDPCYELEDE